MLRLIIVFFCCFITGCKPVSVSNPTSFKERQKQLFYEIDHTLVYQSCQELMRLQREGKLSANLYYLDDPESKQNELPEPISRLQPTSVHVLDMMITISFVSEDGKQSLMCFSNEFGEPSLSEDNTKGLGFRKDPFSMDKLSGAESLYYLNETYDHFEIYFVPGLMYLTFRDEKLPTLEEVKQSDEKMHMIFDYMQKTLDELAMKKQRLLYRTDHHELLKACREIIKSYNDGQFSKAKINMGFNVGEEQLTEDLKRIPKIILNLEPVYVWLHNDRVMVALIGGMDHAGVMAYLNSEEAVARNSDIKLIDGLWYYDDGLREANADYKDYLNSLQKEAIPYLDWKRKQMNLPIPDRIKHRE